MPRTRLLASGLLMVLVVALAAGCATAPQESRDAGDVSNNSSMETENETLPGLQGSAERNESDESAYEPPLLPP